MTRPGRRPPSGEGVTLDDALRSYLSGQGLGRAAALGRIGAIWSELVGPTVAEHVVPWRIEGETLVVAVDDPAWATEIGFLSHKIVAGLDAGLGKTGIVTVKALVRTSFGLE